jgi:hypothetical protein
MNTTRKPKTVRQVVDRLNKHHAYYCARCGADGDA